MLLQYNPQWALQQKALQMCLVITLILLSFAAMYEEVQVGLIISLNEALARYANY